MKVAENRFCGSVAVLLRAGVLENIAGGPALIAKMGLSGSISKEDVQCIFSLNIRDLSIEDLRQSVSLVVSLLDYGSKDSKEIDGLLLRHLVQHGYLFKDIRLNETAINTISSKLKTNTEPATALLDLLSKTQPLSRAVRIALARSLEVKGSQASNLHVIRSIDQSLLLCNEIVSEQTVSCISQFVEGSMANNDSSRADNSLEALKLLLHSGKISDAQSKLLRSLSIDPKVSINTRKKAQILDEEYRKAYLNIEMHTRRFPRCIDTEKEQYVELSSKYLRVFSYSPDRVKLALGHLKLLEIAQKDSKISLNREDIHKVLEIAIENSNEVDILTRVLVLHMRICGDVSPKILQTYCNRVPFGAEETDEKLLNIISLLLKNKKIHEFPLPSIEKLEDIARDSNNSQIVRNKAEAILGAARNLCGESVIVSDNNPSAGKTVMTAPVRTKEQLATLMSKTNSDNKAVQEFANNVTLLLDNIAKTSKGDSKLAPQSANINNFTKQQIASWSEIARKSQLSISNPEHIAEVMAVIARATEIDRGYSPRDIQMMSVLHLLDAEMVNNGRLLQVNTGEGKSLITAMLAASKVLLTNKKVDIITSSSVLAKRDASATDGQKNFYNLLGISCDHNCTRQQTGFKECYASEIVYGDTLSFQSDYLRTIFKGEGLRGDRLFESVIVDEVDSMLIDESSKIAKLAMPICGMEHLETMFIFITRQLEEMQLTANELKDKQLTKQIKESLSSVIRQSICESDRLSGSERSFRIYIPKFLEGFVVQQSNNWADSALRALQMRQNVDYVMASNEEGEKIIAPVDYDSTGIVQKNTSWSNGLHQFLQVKHRVRITPESLTTSFISNMSYFKLYEQSSRESNEESSKGNKVVNISGMSGTLGSDSEKSLLQEIYGLDTAIIPTFREKQFERFEDILTNDHDGHIDQISKKAIEEAAKGRSVLVICETIAAGQEVAQQIAMNHKGGLQRYLRSDENEGGSELKSKSGDIIVATNLAGRGTDIATTEEVEIAGGLHVIIGFMPSNLRVEEQAFGRTSRKGNNGSGQMILNIEDLQARFAKYGIELGSIEPGNDNVSPGNDNLSIEQCIKYRNEIEKLRLKESKEHKVQSLEFEDRLFYRFNQEIYQPAKKIEDKSHKLLQLEDLWGFWLTRQQLSPQKIANEQDRAEIEASFERFKEDMLRDYGPNGSRAIFQNPAYMSNYIQNQLAECNNYENLAEDLRKTDNFDPIYSYQLRNLEAYVRLRHNATLKDNGRGEQWQKENMSKGLNSLMQAQEQLENVVKPQMQSAMLLLDPASNNSPLYKQLDNKLRLIETASKNISDNISIIRDELQKKSKLKIAGGSMQTYESLFASEIGLKEIREFANFGMLFLYRADAQPLRKDHLSGTVVALAGGSASGGRNDSESWVSWSVI